MDEECKKCTPEMDEYGHCECSYCPHSSGGKLVLNERMYGDG